MGLTKRVLFSRASVLVAALVLMEVTWYLVGSERFEESKMTTRGAPSSGTGISVELTKRVLFSRASALVGALVLMVVMWYHVGSECSRITTVTKGPRRWRTKYVVLMCSVVGAVSVYNFNYTHQHPRIVLLNTLVVGSTPHHSNVSTHTPAWTFLGDASFPSPTTTKADVIVFVLGRRDAFQIRQVIRATWGRDHDNVYFVVGRACPLPPSSRKQYTCVPKNATANASKADSDVWQTQVRGVDRRIVEEQRRNGDLLRVDDVDVYRHLPHKLKSAYAWGVAHTRAKWFAKADDDSVVRVDTLTHYLTTTHDASVPAVIGSISTNAKVQRTGKWAETNFSKPIYPNFPIGSAGHVVSRPVAEYIASNKDTLFNYQGEDVSIGIWLDESPLKTKTVWNTSRHFNNHGNCKDTKLLIIGHDIGANKMKACFNVMDEVVHTNVVTKPQQVKDTWNIVHVNPRNSTEYFS